MKAVLLSALVVLVYSTPPQRPPVPRCATVKREAGLTEGFPINVAHRLHSLTLEDLRYYFNSKAPVDNGIPTVNFNLTKNAPRVVPNAPLFGFDTDFGTQAMRHLDQVLRNMDKLNFGIKNYSVLEKVAHVMHMAELWNQAKKYYEIMEEKSPSEELCGCVNDVAENGVLSELELLALKIKYPGLTSGRADLPYGLPPHSKEGVSMQLDERRKAYEISYTLKTDAETRSPIFQKHLRKFDFEGDEDEVLARAMEELQDGDQGLDTHLDSEDGWASWRQGFKGMDDHGNFEFAMFIYCKLNQ